jgi:hypothetical protein
MSMAFNGEKIVIAAEDEALREIERQVGIMTKVANCTTGPMRTSEISL